MKRFLVLAVLVSLIAFPVLGADEVITAIGVNPSSGQVTCDNTAKLLRAASVGRTSVTFQNHSATTVYIAPRSDISTANAGILLNQYGSFTADRTSGDVAWYCTRASTDNATVGWTEEKQ